MLNRWHVYNFLKNVNGNITKRRFDMIFSSMDQDEKLEGVIEYQLMLKRSGCFFNAEKLIDGMEV